MTRGARIVVVGAAAGGADSAAEAVAASLVSAGLGRSGVQVVELFSRFAPRLGTLVSLARSSGAELLPDGMCDLADAGRSGLDEPVWRELADRAVPALEAFLAASGASAVVSTHPLAAVAAGEARGARGMPSVSVVCRTAPRRTWDHPATTLTCVADETVREHVVLHGVPWDRISVTGVPVRPAFLAPGDDTGRPEGASLVAAIHLPATAPGVRRRLADAVSRAGARVGDVSDADPAAAVIEADLVISACEGEMAWSAPAAGKPVLVFAGEGDAGRSDADLLVAAGAALPVRDAEHLGDVVRYLTRDRRRLTEMSEAARRLGRPQAGRAVAERVLSLLG